MVNDKERENKDKKLNNRTFRHDKTDMAIPCFLLRVAVNTNFRTWQGPFSTYMLGDTPNLRDPKLELILQ